MSKPKIQKSNSILCCGMTQGRFFPLLKKNGSKLRNEWCFEENIENPRWPPKWPMPITKIDYLMSQWNSLVMSAA